MRGNGHALSGTPIAVDSWSPKNHPHTYLFFLSHFHSDHTVGLTSSWKYPFYTSAITAKLIIKKLKINPNLVKVLSLGERHIIPLDDGGKELLSVTLFDANHCPGSVMFLFQGYFGNIFYTGDFRYRSDLMDSLSLPPIDVLYLDNTYCSQKCEFHTREYATEAILQRLNDCLHTSKRVYLGMDNLGKEELLIEISKQIRSKICVGQERMETLDILGFSNVTTTNVSDPKVIVVSTNQISGFNVKRWNAEIPTCAILPTARYCGFNLKPYSHYNNIHVIPYSNHSSFKELQIFVKNIHPRSIIPIVNKNAKGMFGIDISERSDMSVFNSFLDNTACKKIVIPESVQTKMTHDSRKDSFKKPAKIRKIHEPQIRQKSVHTIKGVLFENENLPIITIDDEPKYSSDSQNLNNPTHMHGKRVWKIIHINGNRNCKTWYTK